MYGNGSQTRKRCVWTAPPVARTSRPPCSRQKTPTHRRRPTHTHTHTRIQALATALQGVPLLQHHVERARLLSRDSDRDAIGAALCVLRKLPSSAKARCET